jgi:hypothetical protein
VEPKYRLRPSLKLEVRICDDGVLVFDHSSGATHLLDDTAWRLFQTITDSPAALVVPLSGDDVPSDQGIHGCDEFMPALLSAGLVEQC